MLRHLNFRRRAWVLNLAIHEFLPVRTVTVEIKVTKQPYFNIPTIVYL